MFLAAALTRRSAMAEFGKRLLRSASAQGGAEELAYFKRLAFRSFALNRRR